MTDSAKCRVLVVEDEAMISMLLDDMLTGMGCEVIGPVCTLQAAKNLVGRELIDAGVLDINLRGELVYPVADLMAAKGIPFLFSTAYRADSVPERHRNVPVLEKPFSSSMLWEAVKAECQQRTEAAG